MPHASAGFGTLDWIVLGLYFALLVGTGIWLARRVKASRDYFLAGRSMPVWAVAISVLATSLSAATFIGGPQQAYEGNLTYLSATLGTIVAALVVALVFLPAFYRHNVATVYELLEVRFGPSARSAASAMFMLGRVFASGARVFIAAHALSFILFGDLAPGHLLVSIAVLTAAGIAYTIAGGIETVIWTDCVQTVVFVGAITAALIVLALRIEAPAGEVISALSSAGRDGASKLTIISMSIDPGVPFTLWTALTGFALFNMAALGADQDLVQRMLTCRSAWRAGWSVVWSQLIAIPVVFVFMLLGLLMYVFYSRPDLMGTAFPGGTPPEGKEVFLRFITTQMPAGMSGLMIAGLFAIGLASLDSALNAMSSTFVSDFYKRCRPGRPDAHYLLVGRLGVAGWGVVLGLFASVCVAWHGSTRGQTLLEFALSVMVFAYTGLLAVFLCALFTKRGSTASVLAALAAGFMLTLLMDPALWSKLTPIKPLAFPWRMVAATAGAFAVCCAGRRRNTRLFEDSGAAS